MIIFPCMIDNIKFKYDKIPFSYFVKNSFGYLVWIGIISLFIWMVLSLLWNWYGQNIWCGDIVGMEFVLYLTVCRRKLVSLENCMLCLIVKVWIHTVIHYKKNYISLHWKRFWLVCKVIQCSDLVCYFICFCITVI